MGATDHLTFPQKINKKKLKKERKKKKKIRKMKQAIPMRRAISDKKNGSKEIEIDSSK